MFNIWAVILLAVIAVAVVYLLFKQNGRAAFWGLLGMAGFGVLYGAATYLENFPYSFPLFVAAVAATAFSGNQVIRALGGAARS